MAQRKIIGADPSKAARSFKGEGVRVNKEKAMRVSLVCIGAILCILFVFLLVPRLIGWFLPFVLAYILAKIIDPLVNFLHNKLPLSAVSFIS